MKSHRDHDLDNSIDESSSYEEENAEVNSEDSKELAVEIKKIKKRKKSDIDINSVEGKRRKKNSVNAVDSHKKESSKGKRKREESEDEKEQIISKRRKVKKASNNFETDDKESFEKQKTNSRRNSKKKKNKNPVIDLTEPESMKEISEISGLENHSVDDTNRKSANRTVNEDNSEVVINENDYVLTVGNYKLLSKEKVQEIKDGKEEIQKNWSERRSSNFYFTKKNGEIVLLDSCKSAVDQVVKQGKGRQVVYKAYFNDVKYERVCEVMKARNEKNYKKKYEEKQKKTYLREEEWATTELTRRFFCIVFDVNTGSNQIVFLKDLPKKIIGKVFHRGKEGSGNTFAIINNIEIRILRHQTLDNNPKLKKFVSQKKNPVKNIIEKSEREAGDYVLNYKGYKLLSHKKIQEIRNIKKRPLNDWQDEKNCHFHYWDESKNKLISLISCKAKVTEVTIEGATSSLTAMCQARFSDGSIHQIIRCDNLERFHKKIRDKIREKNVIDWDDQKERTNIIKEFVCVVLNPSNSHELFHLSKFPEGAVKGIFQRGVAGDYFANIYDIEVQVFLRAMVFTIKELAVLVDNKNVSISQEAPNKNTSDVIDLMDSPVHLEEEIIDDIGENLDAIDKPKGSPDSEMGLPLEMSSPLEIINSPFEISSPLELNVPAENQNHQDQEKHAPIDLANSSLNQSDVETQPIQEDMENSKDNDREIQNLLTNNETSIAREIFHKIWSAFKLDREIWLGNFSSPQNTIILKLPRASLDEIKLAAVYLNILSYVQSKKGLPLTFNEKIAIKPDEFSVIMVFSQPVVSMVEIFSKIKAMMADCDPNFLLFQREHATHHINSLFNFFSNKTHSKAANISPLSKEEKDSSCDEESSEEEIKENHVNVAKKIIMHEDGEKLKHRQEEENILTDIGKNPLLDDNAIKNNPYSDAAIQFDLPISHLLSSPEFLESSVKFSNNADYLQNRQEELTETQELYIIPEDSYELDRLLPEEPDEYLNTVKGAPAEINSNAEQEKILQELPEGSPTSAYDNLFSPDQEPDYFWPLTPQPSYPSSNSRSNDRQDSLEMENANNDSTHPYQVTKNTSRNDNFAQKITETQMPDMVVNDLNILYEKFQNNQNQTNEEKTNEALAMLGLANVTNLKELDEYAKLHNLSPIRICTQQSYCLIKDTRNHQSMRQAEKEKMINRYLIHSKFIQKQIISADYPEISFALLEQQKEFLSFISLWYFLSPYKLVDDSTPGKITLEFVAPFDFENFKGRISFLNSYLMIEAFTPILTIKNDKVFFIEEAGRKNLTCYFKKPVSALMAISEIETILKGSWNLRFNKYWTNRIPQLPLMQNNPRNSSLTHDNSITQVANQQDDEVNTAVMMFQIPNVTNFNELNEHAKYHRVSLFRVCAQRISEITTSIQGSHNIPNDRKQVMLKEYWGYFDILKKHIICTDYPALSFKQFSSNRAFGNFVLQWYFISTQKFFDNVKSQAIELKFITPFSSTLFKETMSFLNSEKMLKYFSEILIGNFFIDENKKTLTCYFKNPVTYFTGIVQIEEILKRSWNSYFNKYWTTHVPEFIIPVLENQQNFSHIQGNNQNQTSLNEANQNQQPSTAAISSIQIPGMFFSNSSVLSPQPNSQLTSADEKSRPINFLNH